MIASSKCNKILYLLFLKQDQYTNTFSQNSGERKWRK